MFAVLGVAAWGTWSLFLSVTNDYIEAKRPITLIYAPHAECRQVLVPNQTHDRTAAIRFEIGPHGMRGRAPAMPKPDGVRRVAVLGGSSVFDHLTSVSWPERIAAAARGFDPSVESFNAGVPGYTTRDTLCFLRDRVLRYEPDIAILYQGWNDVKYFPPLADGERFEDVFPPRPHLGDRYRFLTEPPPLANLAALQLMWQELERRPGVRENAESTSQTDFAADERVSRDWANTAGASVYRSNVEAFVGRARAAGAEPVLMVQVTLAVPELPIDLRRERIAYRFVGVGHGDLLAINRVMADILHDVGEAQRVRVLDFRAQLDGRVELFVDHVHLRAAGSQRLAELTAEALFGAPP